MTISRRLRFEILRRDGHACRYCGSMAPDVKLIVDHVIPVALGGGDEPNNLVTACQDCNSGKSSSSPSAELVVDVDAAALLFAKAMERAAEIQRDDRAAADLVCDEFLRAWLAWTYEERQADGSTIKRYLPLDDDWEDSIARWVGAGLTMDDFEELIRRAMNKTGVLKDEVFRYFAGCCWGRLTDRQELARRLIEDGEV